MESPKTLITILFIATTAIASAQPIVERREGNVRAQGNLAGGYLFSQKAFSAYLAGDMDLFIDDNVSLTGEAWYGFKTHDKPTGLLRNHAVYWGFNYHPLKKGRWDPYVGLSPGMALVQAGYHDGEGIARKTFGAAPLASGVIGCNYYVGSVFHFFVKARAVAGRFRGSSPEFTNLNEMKLSAGLGWNARLWKKK